MTPINKEIIWLFSNLSAGVSFSVGSFAGSANFSVSSVCHNAGLEMHQVNTVEQFCQKKM